jgi:hypothetical protein
MRKPIDSLSSRQDPAMKRPPVPAALLAALVAASSAIAQQCPSPAACGCKCGPGYEAQGDDCEAAYIDNAIWPRQYINPARRGICQATELMTRNGWRRQNLLGKYHFDESGEKLSEAGRLKVDWILTQAPAQRRTIYIQRSPEAEQTARRIEVVQQLVTNATSAGGPAEVQETNIRDEGHPAAAVDAVFTGFSQNQPTPKLMSSGGSSGSMSSNSASSDSQK